MRNHTTRHHTIDMVSDTAQPSGQIQVSMLSILLRKISSRPSALVASGFEHAGLEESYVDER